MDRSGGFTETELHAWFPFFAASTRLRSLLDSDLRKRRGLSLLDYSILLILSGETDGQARMSDLATRGGVDRSTITYRIRRMEGFGWVERVQGEEDRREIRALITPSGRTKVEESTPDHVDAVRREFLSLFSAEQLIQLGELSSMLFDHLPLDRTHFPESLLSGGPGTPSDG